MDSVNILVNRDYKKPEYTISNVFINNVWFCNILELPDRGLNSSMKLEDIKKIKIPKNTAIPTGTYKVVLSYSPKFKRTLPEIKNVPGFSGIRIHPGNTVENTDGCLLPGLNKEKGKVLDSKIFVEKIINRLIGKKSATITIK